MRQGNDQHRLQNDKGMQHHERETMETDIIGNAQKVFNKEKPGTLEIKGAMETYTCPMHPEVKSDKPGKCPKCGMELVKKK